MWTLTSRTYIAIPSPSPYPEKIEIAILDPKFPRINKWEFTSISFLSVILLFK